MNDGELKVPSLDGKHVFLKALTSDDYHYLQLVETSSELAPRWRYRGGTPSPEQWAHGTWSGVLAQFLVFGKREGKPIGLVSAFQPAFQDGHAHLAAAKFDLRTKSPLMMLGLAVFVQYVFDCWNLRKLYMELPAYNFEQFASGEGRFFTVEGRFRDHFYLSGRYWDQIHLAIYRDTWREHGERIARAEGVA